MRLLSFFLLLAVSLCAQDLPRADGYRGIWYYNQPTHDQYAYKYSGGFATYPQQQSPIAIYAPAVRKTFFCYGGTVTGKEELLHMVSYYDHRTGEVPRPVMLVNKKTDDAHDNPRHGHRRRRLHLDILQFARHLAAVLYLAQRQTI